MTYKEYQNYMSNRANIISQNRSNRLKKLPLLEVPAKIPCPKVRVAYYKADKSYAGLLLDDVECPNDCYIKLEDAKY